MTSDLKDREKTGLSARSKVILSTSQFLGRGNEDVS